MAARGGRNNHDSRLKSGHLTKKMMPAYVFLVCPKVGFPNTRVQKAEPLKISLTFPQTILKVLVYGRRWDVDALDSQQNSQLATESLAMES